MLYKLESIFIFSFVLITAERLYLTLKGQLGYDERQIIPSEDAPFVAALTVPHRPVVARRMD